MRYWFFGSGTDTRAVKNMYFSGKQGSIIAILGHNGAGKTSLINILTGVTHATAGEAYIWQKDIKYELNEISEMIGFCPQFDILWGDLTAREHLQILSKLKLSAYNITEKEIDERLEEVKLLKVADNRSETFSGGMKRRLSVAISTIGQPKIIFMDEPTTGMDPRNRRYVWNLIQKIKQDKLIILTTHSMEEADILGEKIGIMAGGSLKAVGDSLHLKNRFGSGYRLSVVCDSEKSDQVKQLVATELPAARLAQENAGSFVYSLSSLEGENVTPFFNHLQSLASTTNPLVKDWGIVNSTLEDVFFRVLEAKK